MKKISVQTELHHLSKALQEIIKELKQQTELLQRITKGSKLKPPLAGVVVYLRTELIDKDRYLWINSISTNHTTTYNSGVTNQGPYKGEFLALYAALQSLVQYPNAMEGLHVVHSIAAIDCLIKSKTANNISLPTSLKDIANDIVKLLALYPEITSLKTDPNENDGLSSLYTKALKEIKIIRESECHSQLKVSE